MNATGIEALHPAAQVVCIIVGGVVACFVIYFFYKLVS